MADILAEMRQVAEGVKTAKVAKELAAKLGVDAPIIDAMYAIIHEGVPVRDAIMMLLSRARAVGTRLGCSATSSTISSSSTARRRGIPSGPRAPRPCAMRSSPRASRSAARTSQTRHGDRCRARRGARRRATSRPRAHRAGQDRLARRRHVLLAGHVGCRARGRRIDVRARDARDERRALARHRGRAAAGPSRDARSGDGLLPAQQRRGGRGGGACGGCRARRDRRLGRSPRQRHAGHLLERSERPLHVRAPVPVLPGHRRTDGDRRRRTRRARRSTSAARRQRRCRLRRGVRSRVPARAREVQARPAVHLGGLRRVRARSARRHARHARGLRGDGAAAALRRRAQSRAAASSRCSRVATISTGSPAA